MMVKNTQGFTLIELLSAVVLSSFLALTLYAIFIQTNRTVANISTKNVYDLMFATFSHQFEKDAYGAAVPIQYLIQRKEQEDSEKKKSQDKAQEKESPPEPEKAKDTKKEEKKIPTLKKIFFGAEDKGNFKALTFITRNALSFYSDKDQQDVTPLLVRVYYMLTEDAENPGMYRLMRQQGVSLDPAGYGDEKKMQAYEIVNNIKRMHVIYYKEVIEKKEEQQPKTSDAQKNVQAEEKKKEEKKKQPKKFTKATNWSSDEIKSGEPILPTFIEIELTINRGDGLEELQKYIFEIAVSDIQTIEEMIPKEKTQLSPSDAKTDKNRAQTQGQQKRTNETIVVQRVSSPARPAQKQAVGKRPVGQSTKQAGKK